MSLIYLFTPHFDENVIKILGCSVQEGNMNKIPIVFTIDSSVIFSAAVAIKSLVSNALEETFYDIHIFHNGISHKIKTGFDKLSTQNHLIHFHYINEDIFSDFKYYKNSIRFEWYKLLIPDILKEYDKVISAGPGIYFKKDLVNLYNMDISECECCVAEAFSSDKSINNLQNPQVEVMIINCKKLREEGFLQTLLKSEQEYKSAQEIFNNQCDKILRISADRYVYKQIQNSAEFKNIAESLPKEFLCRGFTDFLQEYLAGFKR